MRRRNIFPAFVHHLMSRAFLNPFHCVCLIKLPWEVDSKADLTEFSLQRKTTKTLLQWSSVVVVAVALKGIMSVAAAFTSKLIHSTKPSTPTVKQSLPSSVCLKHWQYPRRPGFLIPLEFVKNWPRSVLLDTRYKWTGGDQTVKKGFTMDIVFLANSFGISKTLFAKYHPLPIYDTFLLFNSVHQCLLHTITFGKYFISLIQ